MELLESGGEFSGPRARFHRRLPLPEMQRYLAWISPLPPRGNANSSFLQLFFSVSFTVSVIPFARRDAGSADIHGNSILRNSRT